MSTSNWFKEIEYKQNIGKNSHLRQLGFMHFVFIFVLFWAQCVAPVYAANTDDTTTLAVTAKDPSDNQAPSNSALSATEPNSPSMSTQLKTVYHTAAEHVKDTWTEGKVELYVPFLSYHMPFAYSADKRSEYNEYPGGAGIGLGRYNASGNYEATYAMAFLDSHSDMSYMVGYAWIPTWNVGKSEVKVGAGLTGFIMSRQDYFGGVPFPGLLPVASISYKQLSLQAAYVPGGQGNGNVLFAWGKWAFD
jgi:lipid IVA palmitoyltransferase